MRLLLEEGSNRAIAERMETSVQMVKNHLLRIFQKVGVEDRLSLAMALIRNGVVECPCGRGARLPQVEHGVIRLKAAKAGLVRSPTDSYLVG